MSPLLFYRAYRERILRFSTFLLNATRARNAEKVEKLNRQIDEQRSRRLKADGERQRVEDLLREITATLWNVCVKFPVRKGILLLSVPAYYPIDYSRLKG